MSELEKKVLEQIEKRGLKPRPYAYFLAKRSVFWALAVISVVLGAVSVAVFIFAATDYVKTGGRGFDEMPFDDFFQVLPLIWLATFVFLISSASVTLRRTPRGYRYSTLSLSSAALALSVTLGALLHIAGAGQRAHEFLASQIPLYERLTRPADKTQANPDKGWLAGTAIGFDGKSILTVKDFSGQIWTVDVQDAKVTLDDPLGMEEDLSIKGMRTGANTFRAVTIEDWD